MEEDSMTQFCHQVQIGSYSINYVKLGSGPIPIFAYPGLLGSLRYSSKELIQKMANEDGGKKYTLYTWDPPGYFLSRPPARKEEDISFEFDADLSAQLLNYLEPFKSQWILVGYSAGSQVAMTFTIKYPERVSNLIVWGAWDLFENDHLLKHLRHRDLKFFDPDLLKKKVRQHGVSFEEYERHWHLWSDMIEREYFNKNKIEWAKKFERINCPTLIIAGDMDTLVGHYQPQWLHKNIKSSQLEVLEGGTHAMQLTHADEMNLLIQNFLSISNAEANSL